MAAVWVLSVQDLEPVPVTVQVRVVAVQLAPLLRNKVTVDE